jgi:hypothetical protein
MDFSKANQKFESSQLIITKIMILETKSWVKGKQWPLDSEFIEFEYSPKWSFWQMGLTR